MSIFINNVIKKTKILVPIGQRSNSFFTPNRSIKKLTFMLNLHKDVKGTLNLNVKYRLLQALTGVLKHRTRKNSNKRK